MKRKWLKEKLWASRISTCQILYLPHSHLDRVNHTAPPCEGQGHVGGHHSDHARRRECHCLWINWHLTNCVHSAKLIYQFQVAKIHGGIFLCSIFTLYYVASLCCGLHLIYILLKRIMKIDQSINQSINRGQKFWTVSLCTANTGEPFVNFQVTGPLCGEFTGPRWIPRTKASDANMRGNLKLHKVLTNVCPTMDLDFER